jgi:hypothetical protein
MKKQCHNCGKIKEVFHEEENKEIDGTKYKIPICYECWKSQSKK